MIQFFFSLKYYIFYNRAKTQQEQLYDPYERHHLP